MKEEKVTEILLDLSSAEGVSGAIHISREGVPSGAISVPCRYVHTSSEMVDSTDAKNAVDFLTMLLTRQWPSREGS